jgi:uncharacterized membrane protein YdjX (TVP38/TMEM64 family)
VVGRRALKWIVAAVLVGAIVVAVAGGIRLDVDAVRAEVAALGLWGPLAFVGLYALATVLFLPGSVMTIAGGGLFGLFPGALYNLLGATLGATAAFLVARYLGAEWVERRAGGRIERLVHGVEAEGWRFVALVRLVPLLPFNLLNYALGLTKIAVLPYAVASFVFMAPGAVAFTWLGVAGSEAAAGSRTAVQTGLLALAALALVAFLPRLVRRVRSGR